MVLSRTVKQFISRAVHGNLTAYVFKLGTHQDVLGESAPAQGHSRLQRRRTAKVLAAYVDDALRRCQRSSGFSGRGFSGGNFSDCDFFVLGFYFNRQQRRIKRHLILVSCRC